MGERYLTIRFATFLFTAMLAMAVSPGAVAQLDHGKIERQCSPPPGYLVSVPKVIDDPAAVNVGLFLIDISEISDKHSTFTVDFVLEMRWRDSRLDSIVPADSICILPLADIWHPHLIFVNALLSQDFYNEEVEVHANGQVQFAKRFSQQFRTEVDLHDFPFDSQDLEIEITSDLFSESDLVFAPVSSATGILEGASIPGFKLIDLQGVNASPIISTAASHSRIIFTVGVERASAHYFWKLLFPLLMVVMMAWAVFWLDPDQIAIQISVAVGAIFSLMAFLVSLGNKLPSISYLSIADKLIVASIILVFAAFGECIVASALAQNQQLEKAQALDRLGRWLYPLLVLMIIAFSFWSLD